MVVVHSTHALNRLQLSLYKLLKLFLFLLAAITCSNVVANETLQASVDRNKIYLNESFTLKLTGKADIDFSFGGLMNFGRSQLDPPVIDGLEDSFEILDRQQNYSMRSINGETNTEITWNYTLSPKNTGKLTIPKAVFKSAKSSAIEIEVLEGKAPVNAANPPPVFIEVEVDESDIYVQQQVKYTVRLYSLGRLSSGNLSEPTSNDAIIEPFGDESKYYRMAYNQRYEVIERNYLLFPQRSGILELGALSFNGVLIDSYKRRRVRVSEVSNSITLNVAPPNEAFSGGHWLPAKSLHISENWQSKESEFQVGDAITREISISALGLLGSAIPPIPTASDEALKSYPDKPIVESTVHEAGSQATRKETTTYIALSPGTVTLPEIQFHWWDTVNDISRVATLPEKAITILPGTGQNTQKAPIPEAQNESIGDTNNSLDSTIPLAEGKPSAPSDLNHALLTIIALLVTGWMSTSFLLIKKLRNSKKDIGMLITHQNNKPSTTSLKLKDVVTSIRNDSDDVTRLVLSWLNETAASKSISSTENPLNSRLTLNKLKSFDHEIAEQLSAFEDHKYGNKEESVKYDPERLIKNLNKYQSISSAPRGSKELTLKPFYPQ